MMRLLCTVPISTEGYPRTESSARLVRMLDFVVVGGGIVGAATAFQYLKRFPGHSAILLEKEPQIAQHQSGHNSGVMHSGLVYRPGSAKAALCREGKALLEEHCQELGIPFERCGKLIIATREDELPRLSALQDRAAANGVETRRLNARAIADVEPAARGLAALHVPETGIVDYKQVASSYLDCFQALGGELRTDSRVRCIREESGSVWIEFNGGASPLRARRVVTCAGLQADRLAEASGCETKVRVVPFLGEYLRMKAPHCDQVRGLIYPVADPRFPFLGVHFTRRIGGAVDCGPNALPTLAREGYSRTGFNARDFVDLVSWPGTWRLASRQMRTAAGEYWRSISKPAMAKELARLLPGVKADWLEPAPAGVRAQALDRSGKLVDDFVVHRSGNVVHLLNAPSPAATSSLAIAKLLIEQ
ncbi:MAG: L-2-hydroxyglutarate oxidase [Candidatus Paceibacteria bacterium]|jgi:L-2-hydroxyglutarate oxidase